MNARPVPAIIIPPVQEVVLPTAIFSTVLLTLLILVVQKEEAEIYFISHPSGIANPTSKNIRDVDQFLKITGSLDEAEDEAEASPIH